ncbi:unnamed protein product, partial [Medioppia subpectinata]
LWATTGIECTQTLTNNEMEVLREDNQRLTTELSIEKQLSDCLEKKTYHSLKNTQNADNNQINTKSGLNGKQFWQLLRHKLPHLIPGADTKTHRRPLLSRDMTDISTGHTFTAGNDMMATDAIKTTTDIIEPNVVSIDLNPTESEKQNTYPIVSADNGLEVMPPIGDDGTQATDNQFKTKQEIIDILEDSDSEDTAVTPVTPTVPTTTVHHYGSASVTANQTADVWLQNSLITELLNKPTRKSLDTNSASHRTAPATDPEVYLCLECRKTFTTKHGLQTHNDMFHRKPMDQLHASGDQQSAAQMAGHITAGFVKDFTPIPAVHNSSQSNNNGTKKRSLMSGTNETQVVDNETTQEIIAHKHKHSTDNAYACHWPGCDYKTNIKDNLRSHQLVHTDDRPYPCEWPGCHYRGKSNAFVKQHLITHSTERSLTCDWPECGKTFKRRHQLRQHQVLHSGPQIPCDRKGCAFKTKHIGALKTHKRLIHKDV